MLLFDTDSLPVPYMHISIMRNKALWRRRYGFMPHRVAFWIYWQALRLLWMSVPFFGYPAPDALDIVEQKSRNPKNSSGFRFLWQLPKTYPWNAL